MVKAFLVSDTVEGMSHAGPPGGTRGVLLLLTEAKYGITQLFNVLL